MYLCLIFCFASHAVAVYYLFIAFSPPSGEIKDEDTGGKTPSFIGPASDLVIVTKSSAVLGGAPVVSSETSSTPVPPPLMVVPTCMPSQSEAAGVPSSVSSPPTATQNQPMRVTVAKSPGLFSRTSVILPPIICILLDILFLLFPASSICHTVSHIISAHFKEKY